MQTLALISFYAPVVIIIVAVLAVLFSFFWVFLPLPRWLSNANGPATDSILALARAAQAKVRSSKRLVVERTGAHHFSVPSR
jgi:hypothetical protein